MGFLEALQDQAYDLQTLTRENKKLLTKILGRGLHF